MMGLWCDLFVVVVFFMVVDVNLLWPLLVCCFHGCGVVVEVKHGFCCEHMLFGILLD